MFNPIHKFGLLLLMEIEVPMMIFLNILITVLLSLLAHKVEVNHYSKVV